MYKLYLVFFLYILSTSLYAEYGQGHIAHLKSIDGQVSIIRGEKILNAKLADKLNIGDIVKTAVDSTVAIIFIDGTMLSCGPGTEMIITKYLFKPRSKEYAFNILIKKGSAIYTSGKIAKLKPKSVLIETPKASIGVRGTKILVKVD